MGDKRVTIQEVAAAAGVTESKVRQFFERPGRMLPYRRHRISEAVRSLGYDYKGDDKPERSHLRIGIISPYSTVYSFGERISGIITSLDPDEYSLITFNVENLAQYRRYLDFALLPGALDGVVVLALPLETRDIEAFRSRSIPLVSIERSFPGVPSITTDNVEAGRQAARFMLGRQYRRPAFMGDSGVPRYAFPAARMRFDGFSEGLAESGIPLPEHRVLWHLRENSDLAGQVARMLSEDDPPDALFCASDTEALEVMRIAWNMGIRVPQQLAILGFDNLRIADMVGLSSVDQFLVQSGRDAAAMLTGMISGTDREPKDIVYETRIRERWTT